MRKAAALALGPRPLEMEMGGREGLSCRVVSDGP